MFRKMMRSKIHRATITQCDVNYVGSITIDAELLDAADMRPNEAVMVFDLDNAARFETYIIHGEPGSGMIGINGAAAHLVEVGHRVIIVSFGYLTPEHVDAHVAKVIVAGAGNKIEQSLNYDSLVHLTEDLSLESTH